MCSHLFIEMQDVKGWWNLTWFAILIKDSHGMECSNGCVAIINSETFFNNIYKYFGKFSPLENDLAA